MKPPLELKLKDIEVDQSLSGRSRKEINDNAKALAPAMKAAGGWDETQPGAVFERGGKYHLARGFTRTAAAEIEGIKTGYFFVIPDDPSKLRTEAIRSNMGKPISPWMQGQIYAKMRDGSDPKGLKKGEVALEPMTPEAIAAEVGYSRAHVSQCIAIYESPEEIGNWLQEGSVSSKVVYAAAKLAKDKTGGKVDESKQVKIVKAAIANATKEGRDCATERDFDAVKEQFAPPLKAVSTKPAKPTAPKKGDNEPSEKESEAGEAPENGKQPSEPVMPSQSAMDLGAPTATTPKPIGKKERAALAKDLAALIMQAGEALSAPEVITETDAADMAEWLIDKGVTIAGTPI